MMNKKEITKFAKAIIHSQKGLKNQQLMHPKREWLTGIVVALSIFIASLTWSSIEYFKYQTIEQQTISQTAAAAAVYRESLVTEALSAYAAKAKRLNTLLTENVPVVPGGNTNEEEVVVDTEPAVTAISVEEPRPSESPAPPVEEGSVQPATNI
jgi:hypothetical protein